MTVASDAHLLSLDDWRARGEDNGARVELQEGVLIVAPRPTAAHARMAFSLATQLADQIPDGFEVLPEVDVIVDPRTPATVRSPDVILRSTAADDSAITPDQVVLAVEVISPGSRRTDRVTKRSEYEDVGIAHYWIVAEDRTLTALDLTPAGYVETTFTGQFVVSSPWELHISLDG
ncbi:Uma2 family endonuclease [Gordonia rhizosphera]|nr:Uma2 family endonuclease [Gordonia rhizosphera]